MSSNERFYQPSDAEGALKKVESLFNSYRSAPLTQELVDYHNNLIHRLDTDLQQAAEAEHRTDLTQAAKTMASAMRTWLRIRASGQPFGGRLRHFKFVADSTAPAFKRKVIKNRGTSNHRASRHGG
ncbi:hypothetical protein [Levilactobacillus bambusae]|uniref:Uncharacterized protein n=1 Tax=Levilactobacillus bambusae TaxID=2024736 RepID=A0A2V1N122_9LACO|nr:hypothetical protein [Levilactobacillus bambusae]PWG00085.1 hypothetical protein DCM90_03885 [Levilactobacillus bambusae]